MDSCTPSTSTRSEILSRACHLCSKTFKNVKLRNRHIKRMHNIDVSKKKMNHIVCPLCEQETNCETHEKLRKHLNDHHQNKERIKMWAHCYRRNSGINTNMAIESFNNLLKTNHLRRNAAVRIEKLLDTIEDLVDIKMWKRIIDMERPNANNYQDRIIAKAHKIAEMMKEKVEVKKNVKVYGQFQVKSFRDPNKLYKVSIRQLCENECKTLFCRVCKICIHRYQCDCAEYVVRNTMCKHVHLVRIYEERVGTNSVLDDAARCLGENSIIKSSHEEEINEFITKKLEQRNVIQENTIQQRLQDIQHLKNVMDSLIDLDDESYTQLKEKIMTDVEEAKCKAKEKFQEATKDITKKRKMEKQQYFPSNKKRN